MALTKSELWTQIANAVDVIDFVYNQGATATPNLLEKIEALQNVFEGNHINSTQNSLTTIRGNYSGVVAQGSSLVNAMVVELAQKFYGSKSSSIATALADIKQGMVDATETVTERGFTFASIVAGGSNIGNGTVYRLYVDKDGEQIESPVGGTVKAEVTSDRHTGKTSGKESFLFSGDGTINVDELERGTAPTATFSKDAAIYTDSILKNSSFDQYSGTGSGGDFALTNWVVSDATAFNGDTANFFRIPPGGTNGVSLKFLSNAYIEQAMPLNSISIDQTKPSFLVLQYNREVFTGDGTLEIKLGSQTENVVLAAQTGWNALVLGVDNSTKGWYDNYKEDASGSGVRVRITLSGNTTGDVLVDDCILVQPDQYNGLWYRAVAGDVDFLVGDEFSWADTVLDTGRIQFWFARNFSTYFPHTSGVPTYPDA